MSSCPGQCPIIHFLGHAFADDAFKAIRSPSQLKYLRVPSGKHGLQLEWKESMQNIPIFRQYQPDGTVAPTRAMTYHDLAKQLAELGYRAKFRDVLRTYCLRRGAANAVDGKKPFLAICLILTLHSREHYCQCQSVRTASWPQNSDHGCLLYLCHLWNRCPRHYRGKRPAYRPYTTATGYESQFKPRSC